MVLKLNYYNYTLLKYFLQDHMAPLLEAIRTNDRQTTLEWARSEHWATVEQLISATAASTSHSAAGVSFGNNIGSSSSSGIGGIGVGSGSVNPQSEQSLWTCPHCTFLNPGDISSCEMCSLPR